MTKDIPIWKSILAIPVMVVLCIGCTVGFIIWPFVEGVKAGMQASAKFFNFPKEGEGGIT
jgi:hypothetical protein